MLRRFTTAAVVLAINALLASAQAHPGSHVRPSSHDSLHHVGMDSAQHAALHALIHGTWTGTISDHGSTSALSLSIAHDSLHAAILRAGASTSLTFGPGHHLMTAVGDTIRWTQEVSGVPCPATAALNARATTKATMEGTIASPNRDLRFSLRKNAE